MQSRIHSKNLNLTNDQLDYIADRVERLSKYAGRIGDEATMVEVEVHRNEHKTSDKGITLEMTIIAPHATIRSEAHGITIEESADQAFDKLKKQIERYKSKNDRRHKATGKMMPEPTLEPVLEAATEKSAEEMLGSKVVKRKVFPMDTAFSDAEAVEQLELLAHDFFLYRSSDSGRTSVVYRRKDGNYGILEAE